MLVRLYGAEDEARTAYDAGEITMPFTDVGATAAPYVAWLYDQGIVNGTSATTFGTGACSAQNYVVFLLRALGYEDGTDFAYADALTFAQEKGFYDPLMFSGTFLRDDLAAVTYQALGTDLKDGSTYLLKSLIDSGAVDAQAAAPMTEKIEAYRALQQASAEMDQHRHGRGCHRLHRHVRRPGRGDRLAMPMAMDGSMQMILDENDLQMAYDFDIGCHGRDHDHAGVAEGRLGVCGEPWRTARAVRTKTQVNLEEHAGSAGAGAGHRCRGLVNVSGLAMVDSITVQTQGANTVYTMVITGSSMNGMLETAFAALMGCGTWSAREDLQRWIC